jgi:hypothetical protein
MKRLLAVSLLVAAVLVPAALAKTVTVPKTITVASSSAVTPSKSLYVSKTFRPPPRSVTVVTSGPVNDVRAEASCFRQSSYYQVPLSKASDNRPGRLAVGYDHTATRCTIRATAAASSAKPGRTFKIAIQIER